MVPVRARNGQYYIEFWQRRVKLPPMAEARANNETGVMPALPRRRGGLPRFQELGLVVVILLLMTVLGVFGKIYASGRYSNNFLNFDNLLNGVATSTAIYAIMAVGMTVVVISGGIDISVGSIFGLATLGGAWVLQHLVTTVQLESGKFVPQWQAPGIVVWLVALAVPVAIGLLCGFINGSLVVGLRMHPFIVTLGTMGIFRGLANVLPPTSTVPQPPNQLPDAFTYFFRPLESTGGLRVLPIVIMVLVAAAGWVFLSQTIWGRETYALGGNEEAARYSGIRVGWAKLRVYVLMGLACGIAAMVSLGRWQTASTNTGEYDELVVIAAAVVGGASLTGGRGTALGALLGALVIRLIDNGILILSLNQQYSKIIIGIAIIIAVAVDRLSEYLRQRRLAGR